MLIVFAVYVIVEAATGTSVKEAWTDRMGGYSDIAVYIICAILLAVNIPLLGLDFQLIALHVYLVSKKLTTYEYITQRVNEDPEPEPDKPSTLPSKKRKFLCEWIIIDRA